MKNAEELARFNKLAETWWDYAGPMWPLHRLNNLRAPFVCDAIETHFDRRGADAPLDGLKILDIGCGAGLLSEAMARKGAAVTGVDPAPRNIDIARAHATESGVDVEYVKGSLETVEGRQFDVVLNMEVVEHVDDLQGFMAASGRCVSPGGLQIVATLNRTLKSFIFAIVGAEYVLGWLPRGTHTWRKFVKPVELESLLAKSGLRISHRAGVAINPISRGFRVTQNTRVNYMLVSVRDD